MKRSREFFCWAVLALLATPVSGHSPELPQDTKTAAPAAESPLPRGTVVLRVSADYLERLFARHIDKESAVDNQVLGTHARGEAHTVADIDVSLEPDDNGAAFYIVATGKTTARTTGHNGPAIIKSRTVTDWTCRKAVTFSGAAFHTQPATIESKTTLQPEGVGSELPGIRGAIVKRVAERRVEESHAQAQQTTTENVRRRILSQVDADIDARVTKLNHHLHSNQLVSGALALEKELGSVKLSTSRDWVNVSFFEVSKSSVPISSENPQAQDDIELWIHNSQLAKPFDEHYSGVAAQLKWLDQALPQVMLPALKAIDLKQPSKLSMQTVEDWLVICWTADKDESGAPTTATRASPSDTQKR